MKNFSKFIAFLLLVILSVWNYTYANEDKDKQEDWIQVTIKKHEIITRSDVISFLWSLIDEIPESYKYIQVKYTDVEKDSKLEDALKKFVYLDRIPNVEKTIDPSKEIDAFEFYSLAKKLLKVNIDVKYDALSWHIITNTDLVNIRNWYYSIWEYQEDKETEEKKSEPTYSNNLWEKWLILEDVLNTLTNYYYWKADLNKDDLMYSAIQWLASSTWDQHTAYFPPTKSQNFLDSLAWEFEWIWAYVDMPNPWIVRIVSPIKWSPAELAWVKGWDIVIKVEGKEVKEENSLDEVVSWIKWPSWTDVNITVKRADWQEVDLKINRQKIIVNSIETEEISRDTIYIQITWFNLWVAEELKKVLEDVKSKTYQKIIFDLRSNGGWYLDEVLKILSELVPEWQKTAEIRYLNWKKPYYSDGPQLIDLSKYNVYILQNSWTASASEIFIWTLKDYFKNIQTIWEKTFGKWSMQEIQQYKDWSMLKYTTAKWFTWWTDTWIDWIWISPDIELKLDLDAYNKWVDNQLEEAIKK